MRPQRARRYADWRELGGSADADGIVSGIVAYEQPYSAVARMGLAKVPFNTKVPFESAPMSAMGWVGNAGRGLIVSKGAFD